MVLQSDVRLGRLTSESVNASKSKIVYGAEVQDGSASIAIFRIDPAISDDGKCGLALAEAPKHLNGLTHFVFDAPPGTYVATRPYQGQVDKGAPTFIVPAGKQVYLGDFSSPTTFSRNIEAAKVAIGPAAANLEIAAHGNPVANDSIFFACEPE